MAKNLNFKVKNAQLAAALKLKKTTKEPTDTPKKSTAKKSVTKKAPSLPEKKKESPVEGGKKPRAKATSLPAAQQAALDDKNKKLKAAQTPPTPPIKAKAPVVVQPPAKTSPPPPKDKEKKVIPKKVTPPSAKPTPPVTEPKKKEFPPSKPAEEPKGFKAQFSRHTKEKRPNARQGFDSRDKQGLRINEERSWRRKRPRYKTSMTPAIEIVRPKTLAVKLPISVKDLAQAMKLKASEIISKLFMQGITLTINDFFEDETTVQLLGHEFGCEITIDTTQAERLRITDTSILEEIASTPSDKLHPRPPIIAFMGHVDHGKTSLIDAIRKSDRAAGEAGAITQHIGAFQSHTKQGNLTILDTPGHEAFTLMRERGATITDVIVLVVAGDEGIMPQTDEAIQKAKELEVPLVVAINKSDKESFNVDNVYRQLADRELLPEAWGGTTITVNCSATTGEGMKELLEMLALQTEILELHANPDARARGTVIEAELHKGFGSVATLIIQNGSLKLGDALVFEDIYARIKTMHNENGKKISVASPSTPVKITGLSGVPKAGCEFISVENEKEARKLCLERASHVKLSVSRRKPIEGLDGLITDHQEKAQKKILNLILRADVQGSIEAVQNSLFAIKTEKVELNFISSDVGEISESDIELAQASNAIILGFHTRVESHAEDLIKRSKVIIKKRDIIYQIVDDIKELMLKSLDKVKQENEMGTVLVKQIFKVSHLGVISGGQVTTGLVKRSHLAKVFRDGEILWEGSIASLKRVKEDVKEVSKGLECGVLLNGFHDTQVDDEIKTFEITYIQQEL